MEPKVVDVVVLYRHSGLLTPLFIRANSKTYQIDKVEYLGNRYSIDGGAGTCWKISVQQQTRYLYKDLIKNHWFIGNIG